MCLVVCLCGVVYLYVWGKVCVRVCMHVCARGMCMCMRGVCIRVCTYMGEYRGDQKKAPGTLEL